MMRIPRATLLALASSAIFAGAARAAAPLRIADAKYQDEERERIRKGPLKIYADETVSRSRGSTIEASGHVVATYDMDNGDRIESFSDFARYDNKGLTGELTGNPRAVWNRKGDAAAQTNLKADKIVLRVEKEELYASGNVKVDQSSSSLTAQEVLYSNEKKQLIAQGGKPEFDVMQEDHHTVIRAERITALTERRQINFNGKVSGAVQLKKAIAP